MKTNHTNSFLLLLFALFAFAQCKKEHKTPLEQLPPETQTGANTFGCLVNGEVFKPGGAQLSGGSLTAIYQYIQTGTPNGYVFAVSGTNLKENCFYKQIGFGFDSVSMRTGIYFLEKRLNGRGSGEYQEFRCNQSPNLYSTNGLLRGELNLKKFDIINQIASGTFWFKAINSAGDTVSVTEGRFDVRYTR
jgi:hypothetical protein